MKRTTLPLLLLLSFPAAPASSRVALRAPAYDAARSDLLEEVARRLVIKLGPGEKPARFADLSAHVEGRDDLALRVFSNRQDRGQVHLLMTRGLFQLAEVLGRAHAADRVENTRRSQMLPVLLRQHAAERPRPGRPAPAFAPPAGFLAVAPEREERTARLAARLHRDVLAYLVSHELAHLLVSQDQSGDEHAARELAADRAQVCWAVGAGHDAPDLLLWPALLVALEKAAAEEGEALPPGALSAHRGYALRYERLEALLQDCPPLPWWQRQRDQGTYTE